MRRKQKGLDLTHQVPKIQKDFGSCSNCLLLFNRFSYTANVKKSQDVFTLTALKKLPKKVKAIATTRQISLRR